MSRPPKTTSPPRAWGCVAINQLAFPGMGTIMVGRRIGYVQATIMVAGFCLFAGFMLWYFVCVARAMAGEWTEEYFREQYPRGLWALWSGLGLCALAWCWSLISSILILREARRLEGRVTQVPKVDGAEGGRGPKE